MLSNRISIIIPIYNKIEVIFPFIEKNILHANQSHEWIIIDNASDLPTKEGLKKIKLIGESKGHEVKIITESVNTGVAVAWNKGLHVSSGKYICILNNDCIMMPGWDDALIEEANQNRLDIFSPFILEPPMFNKEYHLSDFLTTWSFYKKKNKNRIRKGFFGGVVFFGEKKYFDSVGNFDEKYWLSMEDMDYLLRAMKLNIKVGIIGSIIGFHLAAATRKDIILDETANQFHFEKKWGWNFQKNEKRFINKMIRSWRKNYWKFTNKMSTIRERYPI